MKLWYCSPAPFLLDFSIRILFFLFVLECFSSSFLFFHIISVSPFPYFSLYSYPCSYLSSSFTSYLFPSLSPLLSSHRYLYIPSGGKGGRKTEWGFLSVVPPPPSKLLICMYKCTTVSSAPSILRNKWTYTAHVFS